jgi:hypothetical protein
VYLAVVWNISIVSSPFPDPVFDLDRTVACS